MYVEFCCVYETWKETCFLVSVGLSLSGTWQFAKLGDNIYFSPTMNKRFIMYIGSTLSVIYSFDLSGCKN